MDDLQLNKIHQRHIQLMDKTCLMLGNIIQNITQEQATTLRDGPEGWTVLEVVCHLRDFNQIFLDRARMMIDQDYPQLPAYNHEQMAIERGYNQDSLLQAYIDLVKARRDMIEFFRDLTLEQWERAGVHPERGHFTLTDAVIQVGTHEVDHLEQITRILAQGAARR
jgi:hypothetical protein